MNVGPLLYTQPHYQTITSYTLNIFNPHIPPPITGCHLKLTPLLTACFLVIPPTSESAFLYFPPSSLIIIWYLVPGISYSSPSPLCSLTWLNTPSLFWHSLPTLVKLSPHLPCLPLHTSYQANASLFHLPCRWMAHACKPVFFPIAGGHAIPYHTIPK